MNYREPLPDNVELFPYKAGDWEIGYIAPDTGTIFSQTDVVKCVGFYGFAIKQGDGLISVTGSHILWTGSGIGLSSNLFGPFTDRAEIVGTLFVKGCKR